ncbi:MAG: hypothetical protein HOI80_06700 [Alphaproteobacteria bacterium]|jgi:hypothetical protein|nr:hypothetical protein [Alphaproteobacteria bacterium]MBT5390241.1 hypothetical protein [Alphaproteobacteria bacterium]MBT5540814.1 hypothetical protein [Alphaproteobacteria bacterium]MBT5655164.1 hypothetical protein [Alphaproteobacteria bacterium]
MEESVYQPPINDSLMGRYFDPTNDIAFKKIFCTEHGKVSLISFLNAILRLKKKDWIEHVEFVPFIQNPLIEGGKQVIFDCKCRDRKGHEFIVEM